MTFPRIVLGLDTSGRSASCAIVKDGELIAETTFLTSLTHSQIILPILKRTLADCSETLDGVDLFACSAGPGSYTGLRIGIAAIKGLCALGKPCAGVSTLEAMVYNATQKGTIVPVMSARPGVIYFGVYEFDGKRAMSYHTGDRVAEEEELKKTVDGITGEIILTGDCAARIKSELFQNCENITVSSRGSRTLSAFGVCMAAINNQSNITSAENLRARYLQNTMAQKLKDRGERQ